MDTPAAQIILLQLLNSCDYLHAVLSEGSRSVIDSEEAALIASGVCAHAGDVKGQGPEVRGCNWCHTYLHVVITRCESYCRLIN